MNTTDVTVADLATTSTDSMAADTAAGAGVRAGPVMIGHPGMAPPIHPGAYTAPTAVLSGAPPRQPAASDRAPAEPGGHRRHGPAGRRRRPTSRHRGLLKDLGPPEIHRLHQDQVRSAPAQRRPQGVPRRNLGACDPDYGAIARSAPPRPGRILD